MKRTSLPFMLTLLEILEALLDEVPRLSGGGLVACLVLARIATG